MVDRRRSQLRSRVTCHLAYFYNVIKAFISFSRMREHEKFRKCFCFNVLKGMKEHLI